MRACSSNVIVVVTVPPPPLIQAHLEGVLFYVRFYGEPSKESSGFAQGIVRISASIEDQKEYLVAKRYFPQGTTLSDDDRDMLACSNFHYLLGYFRNYNKYKSEGLLPENSGISDVLNLVRMDVKVSSLLYGYMRQSEQAIRAAWVDVFCTYRSPHEYLNPNAYICMNQDRPVDALIKDMMRHILRYP